VPLVPLVPPDVLPMPEPDEPVPLPEVPEPDIEALPDALPLGVDDELLLGELVSVEAVVVGDEPVVPELEPEVLAVEPVEPLPLLPVLVPDLPHPARPAVARAMAATRGRILFMAAPYWG
jgi:hypothetical protein